MAKKSAKPYRALKRTMMVKPDDDQIYKVLNKCWGNIEDGELMFPSKSYEEGIQAGIRWITGDTSEHPFGQHADED